MTLHLYQCFGLVLASTLTLPELPPAPAGASADVEIVEGEAGPAGAAVEPGISLDGRVCILDAVGARIALHAGERIVVQLRRGRGEADARAVLLGGGLAILCHQRGLLPLHASAVRHADGLAAFGGPSGAGKSTLAAALQAQGLPGYCDDLCAIRPKDAQMRAEAGPLRLKLTAESLHALGLEPGARPAVGGPAPKWWAPLAGRERGSEALPLRRLYALRPASPGGPAVRALQDAEAVAAVLGSVHRWPTARAMGLASGIFASCMAIASACRIFELTAAPDVSDVASRAAAVLADLQAEESAPGSISLSAVL